MIALAAHLAAAVALLLWSVRLIRTGIERAFMPELKRRLKGLSGSSLTAAAGGGVSAMLMQSSTAVALIGAGFAVSGMLAPRSALALLLGAELGSAAMTRILLLPVQAIIPFALIVGVAAFFRAPGRKGKQIGRILIGFAMVLISLGMIRTATAPIGENEIVQSIAAYFRDDLLSASLLGALLAWAMHSSLAAVLTFATFAAAGLVAPPVAAALVIGANLGGGIIPVALLWSHDRPARIVVLGNLFARGALTLIFLVLLLSGRLDPGALGSGAAQQAVMLHIAMNAALLALALPFAGPLVRLAEALLPEPDERMSGAVSALDPEALARPAFAMACAQRELLRMAETVQSILVPVMNLFRDSQDLDLHVSEHPVSEVGLLTALQWFYYIAYHRERHIRQIEAIKSHPEYPRVARSAD